MCEFGHGAQANLCPPKCSTKTKPYIFQRSLLGVKAQYTRIRLRANGSEIQSHVQHSHSEQDTQNATATRINLKQYFAIQRLVRANVARLLLAPVCSGHPVGRSAEISTAPPGRIGAARELQQEEIVKAECPRFRRC